MHPVEREADEADATPGRGCLANLRARHAPAIPESSDGQPQENHFAQA